MGPNELSDLEGVLRTQLGHSARWRRYDRDLNSPMSFVLGLAEKHLGSEFTVYWVENAPAELFCLRGFSQPVVVYSTRYIELWADVRALLTNSFLSEDITASVAEQLSLRLIAELSLSKNDPEFSACALLQSMMASQGINFFPNTIMSLEGEPIAPPYMACWFYGLAHELGHFISPNLGIDPPEVFRDEVILAAIEAGLDNFQLAAPFLEEAREIAQTDRRGFILGVDNLRSEALADIFATSLLLEATVTIMKINKEGATTQRENREFHLSSFIAEMIISLNVVAFLDRCRRVAAFATTSTPHRRYMLETLFHPTAVAARLAMVRMYLQLASAVYLFGDESTSAQQDEISAMLDAIMQGLNPAIQAMDRGLAEAMRFSLDRERRASFSRLLEKWRITLEKKPMDATFQRGEVKRFYDLASSLGKQSTLFNAIVETLRDPATPVTVRLDQGRPFLCPWVSGPADFSRPFGLDTKHGHLIFVFVENSDLLNIYKRISAESLRADYKMEVAVVIAETERQIHDAMALRLPVGQQFRTVIEGSEDFGRFMRELAEGTIWSSD